MGPDTAPKLPCAVRGPAFLVTLPMFVGGQFAGLFIDALSAAMGPYWEASVR